MADDAVRIRLLQNIDDLRLAHQAAVKKLPDYDPAPMLYWLYRSLSGFNENDTPSKAVYLVGWCTASLEAFADNYQAIVDFEDARGKLEDYDRRRNFDNG